MVASKNKYLICMAVLPLAISGTLYSQCSSCPADYSQADRETIQARQNEAIFREGALEIGAIANERQADANAAAEKVRDHERALDPDITPELRALSDTARSAATRTDVTPTMGTSVLGAARGVYMLGDTLSEVDESVGGMKAKLDAQSEAIADELSGVASADRQAANEAQRVADEYRAVEEHLNKAADAQGEAANAAAARASEAAQAAPAPNRDSGGARSERPDIDFGRPERVRFDRIDRDGKTDLRGVDRTG